MKSFRVPLLLFVLPAVLLAFMPARHDLLLLDRAALSAGQIWRLWSGHWVHFSASHLGCNLVVLLAAGAWLERGQPGRLLCYAGIAAPAISGTILAAEPAAQSYGGLSGIATGVVVLLSLQQFRTPGSLRWLWIGLLALVAVKTVHDTMHAEALLVRYGQTDIRSSSAAHAAGALSGLLYFGATRLGPLSSGGRGFRPDDVPKAGRKAR